MICALGGILGVMYSIPLRRALVTNSDLPYPEGVACAEVLKVGSSGDSEHAAGCRTWARRSARGACGVRSSPRFSAIIVADAIFRGRCGADVSASAGAAQSAVMIFRFRSRCSPSVIFAAFPSESPCSSARHRLGLGRAAFFGDRRRSHGNAADDSRTAIWSTKVRFIGAGAIGVSAIWTLMKLVKPVAQGLAGAMAANRAPQSRQSRHVADHGARYSDRYRRH